MPNLALNRLWKIARIIAVFLPICQSPAATLLSPATLTASGTGFGSVTSFGSYSFSGTYTGAPTADDLTATALPDPGIAADAGSLNPGVGGGVNATLSYNFEIASNNSSFQDSSVLVDVYESLIGEGSLAGFGNQPGEYYDIRMSAAYSPTVNLGPGQGASLSFELADQGGYPGSCGVLQNNAPTPGCGSLDRSDLLVLFSVEPNVVYNATLSLNISAYGALASALVDPYISIDPSFADASGYSVLVSPNVGNTAPSTTPEPATLFLTPFAALLIPAVRKLRSRSR